MTLDPKAKAMVDGAHLWGLARVRATIHLALSGHDTTLPALAERRAFTLAGADGPRPVRLYRPEGARDGAPLLIYFHGGGFVTGDLDTHEPLCIRLADAAKLPVLAASYRLAPEHPYPAQLDDALALAHAALADPGLASGGPIVLAGDSAGGWLAASVAARLEAERAGTVSAQLLIYPLVHVDEAMWAEGLLRHTRAIGWAAVRYIRIALQAGAEGAPSLLGDGALAGVPTVILTGGPLDPTAPDAERLTARLEALGAEVERRTYPTMLHGFCNLTHTSATAREALVEAGGLIAAAARQA